MPATQPTRTATEPVNPVEADLQSLETLLRSELTSDEGILNRLAGHSARLQGKHLRPSILFACARATGEFRADHTRLGAVVELLHNATLAHDDVLDDADLRRREPSLNAVWGNHISVLFGDYLFARVFLVVSRLENPGWTPILAQTTAEMCVGEILQSANRNNLKLTEGEYLQIIRRKTASLFSAAARLGAQAAGAPEATAVRLADFGLKLGLAFQIVDDTFDVLGEESALGKSLGTDLETGKVTLPLILLLERLDPGRRDELRRRLEAPDRSGTRHYVADLLRESGLAEAPLDRARGLAREAAAALDGLRPSPYRDYLEALTEYVVTRRR